MTSTTREMADFARFIDENGQIDSTGLDFALPLTATNDGKKTFANATDPIGTNDTIGHDFGRMGFVADAGANEGSLYFWTDSNSSTALPATAWEQAQSTEWGGNELPPTPVIIARTSPNSGSSYFNTNVTLEASATKGLNEDPVSQYQFTLVSGQAVAGLNASPVDITPTDEPVVVATAIYPSTITANTTSTIRCTFYDQQGNSSQSNQFQINWIANTAPVITSFTSNIGTTAGTQATPGQTATLTVNATDAQGGVIQYYLQKSSGASISTSPSLNVWTTDNTFTFTIPEIDDGINDTNELVFTVKARDSLNKESALTNETVFYKRKQRTAEDLEIITKTVYKRASSQYNDDPGLNVQYPASISNGDVLMLFVQMAGIPDYSVWNGTTGGGSSPAMKGDDLNSQGTSNYNSGVNPNGYQGAPYIVTNQGWERVHNSSTSTPRNLSDGPYYGSYHGYARGVGPVNGEANSRVYDVDRGGNVNIAQSQDAFCKICDGTETGEIQVFDGATSTPYHRHHAECVYLLHMRLKSASGTSLACSNAIVVYAHHRRQAGVTYNVSSTPTSGETFTFTLRPNDYHSSLTDNPLFCYNHIMAAGTNGGNTTRVILAGSTNSTDNSGLFSPGNITTRHYANIDYQTFAGDTYTGYDCINYANTDKETKPIPNNTYAEWGLHADVKYWRVNQPGNSALGSTGDGPYVYGVGTVHGNWIKGSDVRSGNRTIEPGFLRTSIGVDRSFHQSFGLIQFETVDPLYP